MPTNLIKLKSEEQFTADFQPTHNPIFALFLENGQAYPQVVGDVKMSSVSTVGDIRAKRTTPKDNVIKQIAVASGSKTFSKYFFGNQYIISLLQAQEGTDSILAEVLDEHNKQADDLLMLGEGTAANNVINNGLYWSADPNYTLNNSAAIAAGSDSDHLRNLHAKIMEQWTIAGALSGRRALMLYGDTVIAKYNSLYASGNVPFSDTLEKALKDGSVISVPKAVTPSGANGFMIVNFDQVKLHYVKLPGLDKQGINEEKNYAWFNFLLGSMMVEVKAKNGIIRQPLTFS